MLKTAKCSKTMRTECGYALFKKGNYYKYKEPTDEEFENYPCSYIFFDSGGAKVYMQYQGVLEYF